MNKIIICGKAGSGKDHLKDLFKKINYKCDVSYTTRPKRKGEIDGDVYHFISEEKFKEMQDNGFFLITTSFNQWNYGTSKESWENSKIFIMVPSTIKRLLSLLLTKDYLVVYLDMDEDIRRKRIMIRSDSDSIEKRIRADDKDFRDFKEFDRRICDPLFKDNTTMHLIQFLS